MPQSSNLAQLAIKRAVEQYLNGIVEIPKDKLLSVSISTIDFTLKEVKFSFGFIDKPTEGHWNG